MRSVRAGKNSSSIIVSLLLRLHNQEFMSAARLPMVTAATGEELEIGVFVQTPMLVSGFSPELICWPRLRI